MPVTSGILDSIQYRESGTAGAFETVPPTLFNFPDGGPNPETLPIAEGIDLRVRARDEWTIPIYDMSLFAGLNTLQVNRAQLEVIYTFSGGSPVWTLDPVSFQVVPVLAAVPDQCEVLVAAAGTFNAGAGTAPPGAGWTSVGSMREGAQPGFTVNTFNDGCGRPVYNNISLDFPFTLINDSTVDAGTTLTPFNKGKVDLAVLNPDNQYVVYENVTLQFENVARFGLTETVGFDVQVAGVAANINTLLSLPTTLTDYLQSFTLTLTAVGATQSDYLTIT